MKENAKGYSIRQCFPTDGDWLEVDISHESGHKRIFLSRVIMWALIDAPDEIERIEGLTGSGVPSKARIGPFQDIFYVKATDKSPNGQTWGELYDAITPPWTCVHELSEEQAKAFQD